MTDCSSRWLRAWLLLIVAAAHACTNDSLQPTGVEAPGDAPAKSDSGEAPPAPMDALPDPPDPVAARDAATPSEQADAAAPEDPPPEPPRMSPANVPDAATPERAAEDAAAPERPEDAASPERPSEPPRMDDAWPADCESREKFIAHGMSGRTDTSKYRLEPEEQHLATFIFSLPWGADSVQLLEARPIVDNAKVVHHWALYAGTAPTWLAGTVLVQPSSGATGDDPTDPKFVVGGGPGVGPIRLPDGVGMRVHGGPGVVFMLEIHYFNPGDTAELDASGVELCVTSKPRPIEAAVHFLGTQSIMLPAHEKTDVKAVCNPAPLAEPVHIIAVSPHMHLTGVRAQLAVQRAAGGESILFDEPYAFKEQRIYPVPRDGSAPHIVIESGDRLTTTCSYDNQTDRTLTYGVDSEDEMCSMLLWVWPAGRLHNADPALGTFVDAPEVDCSTR